LLDAKLDPTCTFKFCTPCWLSFLEILSKRALLEGCIVLQPTHTSCFTILQHVLILLLSIPYYIRGRSVLAIVDGQDQHSLQACISKAGTTRGKSEKQTLDVEGEKMGRLSDGAGRTKARYEPKHG